MYSQTSIQQISKDTVLWKIFCIIYHWDTGPPFLHEDFFIGVYDTEVIPNHCTMKACRGL